MTAQPPRSAMENPVILTFERIGFVADYIIDGIQFRMSEKNTFATTTQNLMLNGCKLKTKELI
jgi:hypothetical protein